jgi:hypothetical protein
MPDYADSSFIVSCYSPDANSVAAQAYLAASGAIFEITPLHELEVRNAFQLNVFRT